MYQSSILTTMVFTYKLEINFCGFVSWQMSDWNENIKIYTFFMSKLNITNQTKNIFPCCHNQTSVRTEQKCQMYESVPKR